MSYKTTLKLPVTKFDQKHKKLINVYNGLPPLDQTIVHALSVIYYQTARTHVVNSLKKFSADNTAADYVIHMDPWWNPAVDDQAGVVTLLISGRRKAQEVPGCRSA